MGYRGEPNSQVPGDIARVAQTIGVPITQPVVSSNLREAAEELQANLRAAGEN
jgi:hypothetical protein